MHPTDARSVAVGPSSGLYLSRHAGDSFQQLAGSGDVFGVAYDLDGKHVWFGTYTSNPRLSRIAVSTGAKAKVLSIPALKNDAIAYIAQNPMRRDEIAIASFKRAVFLSQDAGRTWKPIATDGGTHE